MDLSTEFCGLKLQNPLMPGSGPLTGDGERMIFMAGLGLGCLINKTIAPEAAQVPRPCICGSKNMIANSELWSEYSAKQWIGEYLPQAAAQVSIPMIINVGYTAEDMALLIPQMERFAAGYELIPRYEAKDLNAVAKIVQTARKATQKPIWVKMNANLPDPVAFAQICKDNGANGVTAITSLGPNMVIDIKRRRPVIGTPQGFVWTSGPPIKPLALATVNMIKEAIPDISVIGCGGVGKAEDVVEFLLAGADAVQMLSQAMLTGKETYTKIINKLPRVLEENGFSSIEDVKATGLTKGGATLDPLFPSIDLEACNKCGICQKNCPYFALDWVKEVLTLNQAKCFGCGLCESRCPTGAISGVL